LIAIIIVIAITGGISSGIGLVVSRIYSAAAKNINKEKFQEKVSLLQAKKIKLKEVAQKLENISLT
jgi:predicted transcriptional regulator